MNVTVRPHDFGKGPVDPDKLIAEGWQYRDLPWLDQRLWDAFLEVFGAENFHILAMSSRGNTCRGQILLSEQGRLNLVARRSRLEEVSAEVFGKDGRA